MFISFKLMFMLAIIDDVPCFTHFVFYPSLFTLENAIKIISIDNYCTYIHTYHTHKYIGYRFAS